MQTGYVNSFLNSFVSIRVYLRFDMNLSRASFQPVENILFFLRLDVRFDSHFKSIR